jgi:uncharacterized protein YrzB (UPF0473 family)
MDFEIDKEKIKINKNGKEIECDILFTFDSEDTMKSYVGYTDQSVASNGRKNIYISAYNPLDPNQKLENITDERELDMINDVLESIDRESSAGGE